MTATITLTSRDRRHAPTFVARVSVTEIGLAYTPQFAVIGDGTP